MDDVVEIARPAPLGERSQLLPNSSVIE